MKQHPSQSHRRWKTLSLPPVNEVRTRIESIAHKPTRICFQTVLLLCARIGEIITLKHNSDLTANPTGDRLSVELTTYTPNLNNPREFQTIMLDRVLNGKTTDLTEIIKMKEEVAVFTVSTEKRKGLIRVIGLPLNPKYEPWTQDIVNYFQERKNRNIFPFTRQDMWRTAKETFKGLQYNILPYKVAKAENGTLVTDPETGKTEMIDVPEHLKRFTNHGLRHLRNVELRDYYGLTAEERSSYGGWTLRTMIGGLGSSIDRYGEAVWRPYFPKLLKSRL